MRAGLAVLVLCAGMCVGAPAAAQTPRELLMGVAFGDQQHAPALAAVRRAQAVSLAMLARNPDDQEASVIAAVAQGYVAKLTGDRAEAMKARRQIDAVVGRFPRNAEAQLGQGAWHLGVIHRVGRLLGRMVGAQHAAGMAALRRGVALDGDRAFVVGVAGMMLIEVDPADPQGRAWIHATAGLPAPTGLDRIVQRHAARVAAALKSGNGEAAKRLADRLLPFGWYRPDG